jgi:hypothetical protein
MKSIDLNHEKLTNRDYHARPELGSSTLKTLDRDGAEMAAAKASGSVESDSRDLLIGSAVHSFFEGDLEERFAVAPDVRGYKTSDADTFQTLAFTMEQEGKHLLTAREMATVKACSAALRAKFGTYLIGRQKWIEPSLFWNETDDAGRVVSCKCRPDVLVDCGDKTALYLEIKTAGDNGPRAWKSACWRYGYWIQQAHYEAGIRACSNAATVRTIFVVVRKPAPYIVRLYEFDPLTQATAERQWRDLLNQYSRRLATNDWSDEVGLNPTQIDLGMAVQDDLESCEQE